MNRYASHTDDTLLSLLKEGDEAAFTEIYNRYWKRLYAMAYERLKSKDLAEDVVHEVFTSLWQRRQSAAIRTLAPYLAAATRYCILKMYSGLSQTAPLPEEPFGHTTGEAYIDYRFLEQMIREEVDRLPSQCQIVFRYSRQDCLSHKEIAKELGITTKAVEKHISRALRQLRLSLKSLHQLFSFL